MELFVALGVGDLFVTNPPHVVREEQNGFLVLVSSDTPIYTKHGFFSARMETKIIYISPFASVYRLLRAPDAIFHR